jgi:hypothetical protein
LKSAGRIDDTRIEITATTGPASKRNAAADVIDAKSICAAEASAIQIPASTVATAPMYFKFVDFNVVLVIPQQSCRCVWSRSEESLSTLYFVVERDFRRSGPAPIRHVVREATIQPLGFVYLYASALKGVCHDSPWMR